MLEGCTKLLKKFLVKWVDKFGLDNEGVVIAWSKIDALNSFKHCHEGAHAIVIVEVLF